MHVGVYGVLIREKKILLIKKARGPYRGLLDLPGGRIEHGEEPSKTLIREVKEETGVSVSAWRLFENYTSTIHYRENGKEISLHHLGLVYYVTEFEDAEMNMDIYAEDVAGAIWSSLNSDDPLTPFARRAVDVFRRGP